jgi:hypothetical protein
MKYLFRTPRGSLTCRNVIWYGVDGFTSLPKEVMLRIFIAFKNQSPSAGVESANIASSDVVQLFSYKSRVSEKRVLSIFPP